MMYFITNEIPKHNALIIIDNIKFWFI